MGIGDKGISTRKWFRLSKAERTWRVREFRAADRSLQAYDGPDGTGLTEEDETYLDLNGRVNDLWATVPWWHRTLAA
jgi:hypothetical protein